MIYKRPNVHKSSYNIFLHDLIFLLHSNILLILLCIVCQSCITLCCCYLKNNDIITICYYSKYYYYQNKITRRSFKYLGINNFIKLIYINFHVNQIASTMQFHLKTIWLNWIISQLTVIP